MVSKADTPLRICLLGYRSDPFSGGQGIYLRYLSRALVEQGHRVDVLSGEPYPELDPRVRLIQLPGLNLYASDNHLKALRWQHLRSFTDTFEWWSMATGGFPEPYTWGRRAMAYLRSRRDQYDVIHDNQSLSYGLLALRRRGFPVLATIHHPITRDRDLAVQSHATWGLRLATRRWYSFLTMQGRVARRLPQLVTVSESSRRDIESAFGVAPHRIAVVPNGVDTQLFRPCPGVKREPYRVISTASAEAPLKGLPHLLRALAQLKPRYPALKLTLIGRINPRGPTSRLIRELQIGALIDHRSGLSPEAIVNAYSQSSVAVVPSLYEGFGLPAGEAMACGVPVVATTGGALPEVVGDAGVPVSPGHPDALAAGISELFDQPVRAAKMGAAGRERVLQNFTWPRAASALTDLYREICAGDETASPTASAHGNRRLQTT